MPKKRVPSPSRPAAAESEAAVATSEPVKEPTPPLQVFYCASQFKIPPPLPSLFFSQIAEISHLFVLKVCSFPLEYCEFGSSLTRCKEWLKEEHPSQFDKYYSDGMSIISRLSVQFFLLVLSCIELLFPVSRLHLSFCQMSNWSFISCFLEALQAKIGTLSLEAQTKLEKEAAKKEAKAEAKADAALKKKLASQVRYLSQLPSLLSTP